MFVQDKFHTRSLCCHHAIIITCASWSVFHGCCAKVQAVETARRGFFQRRFWEPRISLHRSLARPRCQCLKIRSFQIEDSPQRQEETNRQQCIRATKQMLERTRVVKDGRSDASATKVLPCLRQQTGDSSRQARVRNTMRRPQCCCGMQWLISSLRRCTHSRQHHN